MIYNGVPGIVAGVLAVAPIAAFYSDYFLSMENERSWKFITGCWGLAALLALIQWVGLESAYPMICSIVVGSLIGRVLQSLGIDEWVRGQLRRFAWMRRLEDWEVTQDKNG